jgi:hypothetical protein
LKAFRVFLIDQLHAGNGDAGLDGGDGGGAGGFHGRERAHAGGDGFRDAIELEADFGDDAEGAFGADHQAGQVVAGG